MAEFDSMTVSFSYKQELMHLVVVVVVWLLKLSFEKKINIWMQKGSINIR